MQLSVRDVDERVFREFKAQAVREGIPVGKYLTLAMNHWLGETRKPLQDIRNFKPFNFGKGTEKLSEEIDKILYG
ncbi:MAG: hypothetical protein HY518_04250 [Candidatus Aenigmarchaeota archaeon]|nr:hypothetical protein [Candidatus Aenigmarchaeota archaeon]